MNCLFSIIFVCLTFGCFGQTFDFNSSAGHIYMDETFINIPPYGTKRIRLYHINPPQTDIYSWSWETPVAEFHFEPHQGSLFLVKTNRKTRKITQTIKILSYR